MRWTTVMLAAIVALSSASIAAAECAWVLWLESAAILQSSSGEFDNQASHWRVHFASETSDVCDKKKHVLWEERLQEQQRIALTVPSSQVDSSEDSFVRVVTTGPKGSLITVFNYRCLPDTIDPREGKE